jgi:hypothetical protein
MKYFRSKKLFAVSPPKGCVLLQADSFEEAKKQGVDVIDISYADFCEIRNQFEISNLDSHYLGAADSLVRLKNKYQFFQLSQKAFLLLLSKLALNLKTDDHAVIVGDELSISQFLPALAKLGYSKFVLVVENTKVIKSFVDNIQKTLLGLELSILEFKQVSLIDCISSLLLVDVDHKSQAELVESLTYFNFLTTGSVFFDVRSESANELVQEALRAQMFVVESAQFMKTRFEIALQITGR